MFLITLTLRYTFQMISPHSRWYFGELFQRISHFIAIKLNPIDVYYDWKCINWIFNSYRRQCGKNINTKIVLRNIEIYDHVWYYQYWFIMFVEKLTWNVFSYGLYGRRDDRTEIFLNSLWIENIYVARKYSKK